MRSTQKSSLPYQRRATIKPGKLMAIRTSALFCFALFGGAVLAAPTEVEILTKPCAECHGSAGVSSTAKTPHLNSQLSEYLEEEISGLAKSTRASGVPNHVPKTWTGSEIASVAKFYAASKEARPVQSSDPLEVAKGAEIYKKSCALCHPNNGRESDHDAPLMAAQNIDYMMEQTRAFVSGKRKFVFQMDDAFRGLSPAQLDSVAHFFGSQDQFKK
ncbi:MAG: c-type cytochrome [Polaromonas sp.]